MRIDSDLSKPKTASANKTNNSSSSRTTGNYTVKSGETLYSLMKKFNFKNEAEIRQYLKLTSTQQLKKGQNLTFPSVKLETTLSAIARKYNISVKELMVLNPEIKDSAKVPKGQLINVPIRPFPKSEATSQTPVGKIQNLSDVAKRTGLSESFLLELKRSEDGIKFGDNKFHTTPYKDKNGNWTIGIGHLITDEERSKYLGKEISVSDVLELFVKDIDKFTQSWKNLIGENQYNKLPISIKDAITDYIFNRGSGTLSKQTEFLNALKSQDYAKAISLMNVDYSYKKDKNGKKQIVYLTGLSKRRLFDMYLACKMYKGNIPAQVKSGIQNMYNRGVNHMQTEFPDPQKRKAVLQSYNNEVKSWFGDIIKYR